MAKCLNMRQLIRFGFLLGFLFPFLALAQGKDVSVVLSPELENQVVQDRKNAKPIEGVYGALLECRPYCLLVAFVFEAEIKRDPEAPVEAQPDRYISSNHPLFNQLFAKAEVPAISMRMDQSAELLQQEKQRLPGEGKEAKIPYAFKSDMELDFRAAGLLHTSTSSTTLLSQASNKPYAWLSGGISVHPFLGLNPFGDTWIPRIWLMYSQSFFHQRQNLPSTVESSEMLLRLGVRKKYESGKLALFTELAQYKDSPVVSSPEDFKRSGQSMGFGGSWGAERWKVLGTYRLTASLKDEEKFRSAPLDYSGYYVYGEYRWFSFGTGSNPVHLLTYLDFLYETEKTSVDSSLLTSFDKTEFTSNRIGVGFVLRFPEGSSSQ